MTATESGRTRRPQLNDSIGKLNDIIEGLSTAVPEVVADTLKQSLGSDFAVQIGQAVVAALVPHLRTLVAAEVKAAMDGPVRELVTSEVKAAITTQPTVEVPLAPPRPTRMQRIRGWFSGLRQRVTTWFSRQWQTFSAVASGVWSVILLLVAAVLHAPAAVPAGLLTAAVAGSVATLHPAVAAIVAGVAAALLGAVGVAAAPLVRLAVLAPLADHDEPGR